MKLVPYGRRRPPSGAGRNGPLGRTRVGSPLIFLAALALAACAPHPRYISVYCVTPTQLERLKAAEPPRVGDRLTGQAQDDFKIAAGSAVELRSWGEGLLGVLEGCVGPKVSTIGDK